MTPEERRRESNRAFTKAWRDRKRQDPAWVAAERARDRARHVRRARKPRTWRPRHSAMCRWLLREVLLELAPVAAYRGLGDPGPLLGQDPNIRMALRRARDLHLSGGGKGLTIRPRET